MLTSELEKDFHDLGLELHYFKIKWYNDAVDPKYFLQYNDDTLAFIVLSNPSWFEKAFLPFLSNNIDPSKIDSTKSNIFKDPIDQCMIHYFDMFAKKISLIFNTQVDKIHDFELLMPFRRPKVLLQTAAHVSGAAYYYKSKKASTKHRLGVCIHPNYGGWFGLRGVFILKEILKPDLKRILPQNVIPDEKDQEILLNLFNEHWRDGTYRDFIPVKSRYSDLQFKYFSLKPRDRAEFIRTVIYPVLDKLINHNENTNNINNKQT